MGFGNYSFEAHRALSDARTEAPRQTVFRQTETHPLMRPLNLRAREARDSEAHPRSLPIVLALDVTGSMGEIPELLAKRQLPLLMKALLDLGVADPQVLFMAVGDAFHDRAPLQIGQFESTAELMDQWLTWSFIEGRGGNPGNESYELALHVAARHLELDSLRLRGKRGYLFLTGDEKPYPQLSKVAVKQVLGTDLDEDTPLAAVVEEASRTVEPYFLIPDLARRAGCERAWRVCLGDRVIAMESPLDTTDVIAAIVAIAEGHLPDLDAVAKRLASEGRPRERVGAVFRALVPWAASIEKDGAPAPTLEVHASVPIGVGG